MDGKGQYTDCIHLATHPANNSFGGTFYFFKIVISLLSWLFFIDTGLLLCMALHNTGEDGSAKKCLGFSVGLPFTHWPEPILLSFSSVASSRAYRV